MKVLISTGGSGGHIFPALQTGLELKRRGHEVVFAGALSMSLEKIRSLGFQANLIEAEGLTDRSPLGFIRFATRMGRALLQALHAIHVIRPDKVIGFGGYGSFPVLMAAWLKGYPTMLHEQNVIVGKANKILGKCVNKVAVTFKETLSAFGRKAVWTGCPCNNSPINRSVQAIKEGFGLRPDTKVVVLLGGSQGSQFLNQTFYEAMKQLLKDNRFQAIHVTGKAERLLYEEKYKAEGIPVIVRDFISPIEEVYAVGDVMISRAGAATICELGFWGIPSILVPYPFAHGHQVHNARVLVRAGSATLIEQKDLNVNVLLEAIRVYDRCEEGRKETARKNSSFFVLDAVVQLANALEAL